jgi:hypothetical protein
MTHKHREACSVCSGSGRAQSGPEGPCGACDNGLVDVYHAVSDHKEGVDAVTRCNLCGAETGRVVGFYYVPPPEPEE